MIHMGDEFSRLQWEHKPKQKIMFDKEIEGIFETASIDDILKKSSNVIFRWIRHEWHGGQKTAERFTLSIEDKKYFKHFYANLGYMKQEINLEEFKNLFETYMKKTEYKFSKIL